jgi:hypothetical protein
VAGARGSGDGDGTVMVGKDGKDDLLCDQNRFLFLFLSQADEGYMTSAPFIHMESV